MFKKLQCYEQIVEALLTEGQLLKALNFAQEQNVHSLKYSLFQQAIDKLKFQGKHELAEIVLKRVLEVRKVRLISNL